MLIILGTDAQSGVPDGSLFWSSQAGQGNIYKGGHRRGFDMNRKKRRGSIHSLYTFRSNSFTLAARVLR